MPAHRNGPRQTAHSDSNDAASAVRSSPDPFAHVFSFSADQDLTREMSRNLGAIAQCSTILARGFQDLAREWLGLAQDRLQRNLEGINALAHCRSVPELLAAQANLVRDNLDAMISNGRRLAELSVQVANQAADTVAQAEKQTARAADRARRAG